MNAAFRLLLQTRQNLLSLTDGYSLEELNQIPEGFNNNLFWHLGHVLVTQQLLVYRNSGVPLLVSDKLVEAFRKGSKPDGKGEESTLAYVREQLPASVEQTWDDYQTGKFANYKDYPTSFGFQLSSVEDAILFNNTHEGLHFGYAQALRRALKG